LYILFSLKKKDRRETRTCLYQRSCL